MSITSVSTVSYLTQYTTLSSSDTDSSQSSASNSTGATTSTSIGVQILTALQQADSANGNASNSLLQDVVTLSSTSSSSTDANGLTTYNAKGLLEQVQNMLQTSDPLLASDSSDSSNSNIVGGIDLDAQWSSLLQQDPGAASLYVQSQTVQSRFSTKA